jgi:endoglucanase
MKRTAQLCVLVFISGLASAAAVRAGDKDAYHYNRLLGRGMNIGNALEAPREGDWGITLKEEYFAKIKEAGFDSVRLPMRWSAHAGSAAPFTVEPAFFKRIDWAVEQILSRNLAAIINVHHFDEIVADPDKHLPRLEALWTQIADRYRDRPDKLYFELLNEPNSKLTDELWNQMIPRLLRIIRAGNPQRMVIVGPGQWNNVNHLDKLRLPEKDRRLIATFHYYSPFQFTHQGASWAKGSKAWLGKTWKGTAEEREALRKDFAKAAAWGKKHDRPLFLGEFGAYSAAPMESRSKWTAAIVREAAQHGFSWAYWEFGAGFGAYDPATATWRPPLLQALMSQGSTGK